MSSKPFVKRFKTTTKKCIDPRASRRRQTHPAFAGWRISWHAKTVNPQTTILAIGGELVCCCLSQDMIQTFRTDVTH